MANAPQFIEGVYHLRRELANTCNAVRSLLNVLVKSGETLYILIMQTCFCLQVRYLFALEYILCIIIRDLYIYDTHSKYTQINTALLYPFIYYEQYFKCLDKSNKKKNSFKLYCKAKGIVALGM